MINFFNRRYIRTYLATANFTSYLFAAMFSFIIYIESIKPLLDISNKLTGAIPAIILMVLLRNRRKTNLIFWDSQVALMRFTTTERRIYRIALYTMYISFICLIISIFIPIFDGVSFMGLFCLSYPVVRACMEYGYEKDYNYLVDSKATSWEDLDEFELQMRGVGRHKKDEWLRYYH